MQKNPEIRKENGIWTLFVDGKPFTMLCGEVHNSSASDAKYMEEQVWPFLKGLHINSLLVPVYWEMIEKRPHSERRREVLHADAGKARTAAG